MGVLSACHLCGNPDITPFLFLGHLPLVNKLTKLSDPPQAETVYPSELSFCASCALVQLNYQVDPHLLFPEDYPYTASSTKMLRDNFAQLHEECCDFLALKKDQLVIDLGCNDGLLLSYFKDQRRCGVTPESQGKLAQAKGIPTFLSFFDEKVAKNILAQFGQARLITATYVLAHVEDVHAFLFNMKTLLSHDGTFVCESHDLLGLLETVQFDTFYHEHTRYYSLSALKALFDLHELEIFRLKRVPCHGGSWRLYVGRKSSVKEAPELATLILQEKEILNMNTLKQFAQKVRDSKLQLLSLITQLKKEQAQIIGISAPSRATALLAYTGLDESMLDAVVEVAGSLKLGHFVPGTRIPIVEEAHLYQSRPPFALILSWHLAKELMPKIKAQGFRGDFIVPLPVPKIVLNDDIL